MCEPTVFEQNDEYPYPFGYYQFSVDTQPSEEIYTFTLGKPDTDIEQAFNDEAANLSFEITVRLVPPTEADFEWLEECERALEESHDSDMPSSPMDMDNDMPLTDMSDMPSSGSNQSVENEQGCSIAKQRPHKNFVWFVVLGILLALRKKRE